MKQNRNLDQEKEKLYIILEKVLSHNPIWMILHDAVYTVVIIMQISEMIKSEYFYYLECIVSLIRSISSFKRKLNIFLCWTVSIQRIKDKPNYIFSAVNFSYIEMFETICLFKDWKFSAGLFYGLNNTNVLIKTSLRLLK